MLGIILARAGSKGLPDKCVRQLLARPVIDYTFDHALAARLLTHVVFTTDSQAAMAYEIDMDPAQRATFRERIAGRLDEMRRPDGTYDLTYVRLEAVARRPA